MDTKTRPINMLSTRNPVLYDILDKRDLINFFRTFHPNAEEYTFFSSVHGTFSKIDLKIKKITRDKEGHYTMIKGSILGHDSSLSKFKKIEILSSIFNNHNAMRLDINYKKKLVRSTNTWRLNIMFLKNQQVTEEIKKEIKKISRNK